MSNFKNPFLVNDKSRSVPMPRLRGNAFQRDDKSWGWDFDIFIGEDYVASMSHPDDSPGFATKDGAIADMREKMVESSKVIGQAAYGCEKPDGFFDLNKNEYRSVL